MKKTAFFIIFLFFNINVNAAYIGFGLGDSKFKIDGDSLSRQSAHSYSLGTKVDLPLAPIRTELEYFHFKSSDIDTNGLLNGSMINGYLDFPFLLSIKSYLGVGIGYMQEKVIDNFILKKTNWTVNRQYMIGLDMQLPILPLAGGIEYRYIDTNFDIISSKVHAFLLKVRMAF